MNRYEEPRPTSRSALESALEAGDTALISERLIALALQGYDPDSLTPLALGLTSHASLDVRKASLTALGHMARVHRCINRALVIPRLTALADDPAVAGKVADVMDDINQFTDEAEET